MRFELNKSYPFIAFSFTYSHGGRGGIFGFSKPIPWRDTIHGVTIKTFTCVEHHRVRWDYDDNEKEPKYDGFVFTADDGGRVWHNQYPRASYGQLSDRADGLLNVSNISKEESESDDFIFSMYSAFRFLDECVMELHYLKENLMEIRPEEVSYYVAKLKEHYEDVKAKVEAYTGKKIVSSPIVFTDIRTGTKETLAHLVRHKYAD